MVWAFDYLKIQGLLQNINIQTSFYDVYFSGAAAVDTVIQLAQSDHTLVVGNYLDDISRLTGIVGGTYGVAQLSATARDDVLSDKNLYPYYARVISNDSSQAQAIVSFIKHFFKLQGRGWDKIAVILATSDFGVSLYYEFAALLPSYLEIVTVRHVMLDQEDVLFDVQEIKNSGARVMVGFIFGPVTANVLLTAKQLGINGPNYVWILNNLEKELSSPHYHPSDEYVEALRGCIAPAVYVPRVGKEYEYLLEQYTKSTGDSDMTEFMMLDFDMGLLTGYALEEIRKNNLMSEKGEISAQTWFETFTNVSFAGASGHVKLNEVGDRDMNYAIVNYVPELRDWVTVAVWNLSLDTVNVVTPIVWADNSTKIPDLDIRPPFHYWSCHDRTLEYDRTGKTIHREDPDGDDVDNIDSDYYCDGYIDCVNFSDESVDCGTNYEALFISFGILTGLMIIGAILLIPFVIIFGFWKRWKRVTAASPVFQLIVIVSAIVGMCSTFAWYGKPHPVACGFQPWLLGLSVISMVGALSAKTFRIWRIFKTPFTKVIISDVELLVLWVVIVIPGILILALWTLISTPTAEMQERDNLDHYLCATGGFTGPPGGYVFFSIFVGYGAIVVGFALFLSIVTRNVPSLFNDSSVIAITMYNITFLAAVGIPVVIVLNYIEPFAGWIVRTAVILYVFSSTLILQFFPKIIGMVVFDKCKDYKLLRADIGQRNWHRPTTSTHTTLASEQTV